MEITRITSYYDPDHLDDFDLEIMTDMPDDRHAPSESVDDTFDSFFTLPCKTYDELIILGKHDYFQDEDYFNNNFGFLIQIKQFSDIGISIEDELRYSWWSYDETFIKFVCDYLNQNFISLAAVFNAELEDERTRLECWARELMRFAPTSQNYNEYLQEVLNYIPDYKKRVNAVKIGLETLKYDDIKHMVDTIFIDNTYPALTAEQKYYAYSVSYRDRDGSNVEYGATIRAFGADKESITMIPDENGLEHEELCALWLLENKASPTEDSYNQLCETLLKSNVRVGVYEKRDFHTLKDCVLYYLYEMIKYNIVLKICPNCAKYFVPQTRSDTIYCTNKAPQDETKTCQEYGKYINYLRKTQNDEATKLYKQIFNQKANKVRRCKAPDHPLGNPKLNTDFEEFTITAKKWKTDIKAGTKTEVEYIEWLKAVKEKKVL